MSESAASRPVLVDPVLALSLWLVLVGACLCAAFPALLTESNRLGAAPLYLLVMPACLAAARLRQLLSRVSERPLRRPALRRPATRQRPLRPTRRRLKAALVAALVAPLPR
jgi:hypothetical protein